MDKRYQVFVSSTYLDLIDERQEVMQALLETDCIPAGMELFPASSDTQWDYIKRVIDECDYYILILAGRYGSLSPDGTSYTEKEYRYALDQGKPVISFLHKSPDQILVGKSESEDKGKEKLGEFRRLVQGKLCKFYATPQELGAVVSRSITQIKKSHPAVGWVKADSVIQGDSAEEILKLKREIENLEGKLRRKENEEREEIDLKKIIEIEYSINHHHREEGFVIETIEIKHGFKFDEIVNEIILYLQEGLSQGGLKNIVTDFIKLNVFTYETAILHEFGLYNVAVKERDIKKLSVILTSLDVATIASGSYWLSSFGEKLLSAKVESVFLKEEINA